MSMPTIECIVNTKRENWTPVPGLLLSVCNKDEGCATMPVLVNIDGQMHNVWVHKSLWRVLCVSSPVGYDGDTLTATLVYSEE